MADKVYTWSDVEAAVTAIQVNMHQHLYLPDYIVGYRAGGAVPAVMLASRLGVPVYFLDKNESNTWMAEDAAGGEEPKKQILVVTDFNRHGDNLQWIKRDWAASIHADPWKDVWHKTTRFASLLENANSDFETDYSWRVVTVSSAPELNPLRDDDHIFPWDARAALARVG